MDDAEMTRAMIVGAVSGLLLGALVGTLWVLCLNVWHN